MMHVTETVRRAALTDAVRKTWRELQRIPPRTALELSLWRIVTGYLCESSWVDPPAMLEHIARHNRSFGTKSQVRERKPGTLGESISARRDPAARQASTWFCRVSLHDDEHESARP